MSASNTHYADLKVTEVGVWPIDFNMRDKDGHLLALVPEVVEVEDDDGLRCLARIVNGKKGKGDGDGWVASLVAIPGTFQDYKPEVDPDA